MAKEAQPPTLWTTLVPAEVDKPHAAQPTAHGVQIGAVPGPVAKNRVDQAGDEGAHQYITAKAHALGNGARGNGHGSAAEHGFVEQEDGKLHAAVAQIWNEIGGTD